jgi:predicted phosphoadenosine phosphosulfate sulfurtransferase
VSSGKDSTVLFWLCVQEALKRGRMIDAFFLDQEAEYQASIDIMKNVMRHECVQPHWYQVPIYMTNSTSRTEYFLYSWENGKKWIREKDPIAIQKIEEDYPKRFYEFFKWYEKDRLDTAFLVGLRADESITRFRAVTKFEGYKGIKWSTADGSYKFYPIYDWTIYDVWKFIYEYNIPYNKVYDLMFMDGKSIYSDMRVSNLIHEKSYKCLVDLPRYEPETYNKLCDRISGISTAARYASEKQMFSNKKLPSHYKTWKDFRDFLLNNMEDGDHRETFIKRFEKQDKNEKIYQAQVGQLLINDYENSRPFDTKRAQRTKEMKEKWQKLL